MKSIVLLVAIVSCVAAFKPSANVESLSNVGSDTCTSCFNTVNDIVDDIQQNILNGLLGSCAEVCQYLEYPELVLPCAIICEYVGFNEFISVMNDTDPDPVWMCQEFDLCPVVSGGAVTITEASIFPESGPAGTVFNITFTYEVTSPIGPGLISVDVNPPTNDTEDGSMGFGSFNDQQPVGSYFAWTSFGTTPSEFQAFMPGKWIANAAVCAGDCTNAHSWGGIYAQVNVPFILLNSTLTGDML